MGIVKKLLLLVAAVTSGFIFMPAATGTAANDFAATISPLPVLLNAKPGTSVSYDLRVNNPSAHDEKLKVLIKTFTQDGPDGVVTIRDPTPADTFINWISFDKTEFEAPPGLWQTVKMTVNVPKSASLGYYFAVEFTAVNPAAHSSGNGTSIQGAVASFVLLNTQSGKEKRQIQVTSFTANHSFYEFLPAAFTVRLHNSGNIFAGASGNIFIKRGSKQVGVLNVNPNHGLVLPGSNRVFTASWEQGFPVYKVTTNNNGQPIKDKDGNDKKTLDWNFSQISKLRFGHYTAQLALVYNDGQRDIPINGNLSFWVIPWRLIVLVLLVIIGPAVVVYIIMRRRFRKRIEQERRKIRHEAAK